MTHPPSFTNSRYCWPASVCAALKLAEISRPPIRVTCTGYIMVPGWTFLSGISSPWQQPPCALRLSTEVCTGSNSGDLAFCLFIGVDTGHSGQWTLDTWHSVFQVPTSIFQHRIFGGCRIWTGCVFPFARASVFGIYHQRFAPRNASSLARSPCAVGSGHSA
jgi:hypothetical protein